MAYKQLELPFMEDAVMPLKSCMDGPGMKVSAHVHREYNARENLVWLGRLVLGRFNSPRVNGRFLITGISFTHRYNGMTVGLKVSVDGEPMVAWNRIDAADIDASTVRAMLHDTSLKIEVDKWAAKK